VETHNQYYDVSETAIKDHSMLGAHGEKLCSNLDVRWTTKACNYDKNETETGKCSVQITATIFDWDVIYQAVTLRF